MFCQLKVPEVMSGTWDGVVRTKVGVVVMFPAELVTFAVGDGAIIDLVMSSILDDARVWTKVELDMFKAKVVTYAVGYGALTIGRVLLIASVVSKVTTTDGVMDIAFLDSNELDTGVTEAVMFPAEVVTYIVGYGGCIDVLLQGSVEFNKAADVDMFLFEALTFIVGYGVGMELLLHDPDACDGFMDVDIVPAELVTFAIGYGGTCACLPVVAVEATDVMFPDKLVTFTIGYRTRFVGGWSRPVDAITVMFPADFVTFGMGYGGNATGRVVLADNLPLDFVTFPGPLNPVILDDGSALAEMLPAGLVTFFGIGYRGTGTGFIFALAFETFDEDVLAMSLVEFVTFVGYGGTGMGTRIGFLGLSSFDDIDEDILEENVFVGVLLVEFVTCALCGGIGIGTEMGIGIGFIPAVDLATVEKGTSVDEVLLVLMLLDLPDFSDFGSDFLAVGSGARVFLTVMVSPTKISVICSITVLVSALVCICVVTTL